MGNRDYSDPAWMELREKVLSRDGHQCRNCGDGSSALEVHHWRPLPAYQDAVDDYGYALSGNAVLVHESGLITLCRPCHEALTECRKRQARLASPQLQTHNSISATDRLNIFQIWALGGERLPFKVRKETWSQKVEQFYLVEEVTIGRWPYGAAWGRYCRDGALGDREKIKSAGTYTWQPLGFEIAE